MAKKTIKNSKYDNVFFDRTKVINALDEATHKNLSRLGAYVMTGARRRIRKRKKSSSPGESPSSHVGSLRNKILFSYDKSKKICVIGPEKIRLKTLDGNGRPVWGTVPSVLEYGGSIYIREYFRNGRWFQSYGTMSQLTTRLRRVRIVARPYMQPAFRESLPKIKQAWKNSVRSRF